MKPLKLYKIDPEGLPVMHVAARSNAQAAEMFVTWQAAQNLTGRHFAVELETLDSFPNDQQLQLETLLAISMEGVARLDESDGWTIDSDGWFSFDVDEIERPSTMRIFQMRDLTPIEAFVLASESNRASVLFEQHLRAHGQDPDDGILYREVGLEHLDETAHDAVHEALDIGCEGLVTCDTNGSWTFISPLGEREPAIDRDG